ncbi:MAG TPA: CarD family transcriptional regulator [Rubrobacteraceae bacterium]|nr:CarD family transcriptional regulator [Rubrobacteraceae bacterium]
MAGEDQSKDGVANTQSVAFSEGDLVVYPSHGAGCVAGIEQKTILGEERRYYIVYIPDAELTLSIPADGETGLRSCSDEESVEAALSALEDGATEMPSNWNHRLKHNREKIRSGEIAEVAEVVRNLSVYGGEHGLSTGERNMLMKARQILISEIALVREMDISEAESLVDGALSNGGSGN